MRYEKDQRVHVRLSMNESRREADPFREGTVTRVGRKYVYVTFPGSYGERKFEQATGGEATNYSGKAATIMDDEQRAAYDRRCAVRARFCEIGLGEIASKLDRFSPYTIEGVLGLLEADYASHFEDVAR